MALQHQLDHPCQISVSSTLRPHRSLPPTSPPHLGRAVAHRSRGMTERVGPSAGAHAPRAEVRQLGAQGAVQDHVPRRSERTLRKVTGFAAVKRLAFPGELERNFDGSAVRTE